MFTSVSKVNVHLHEIDVLKISKKKEIIDIISSSDTSADAQFELESRYHINNVQSKIIVDMRLSEFTQQRINAINAEHKEIVEQISQLIKELSINL